MSSGKGWGWGGADLLPSAGSKPTGLAFRSSINWKEDWSVHMDLGEHPKIVLRMTDLA